MDFKCNNPGAVQFGNFINYYQFNSAEERLKLLPNNNELWNIKENNSQESYILLDIGCNSGVITQLIYNYLKNELKINNLKILGIDIDPILIKRAKEEISSNKDIEFYCLDIMNSNSIQFLEKYLKTFNKIKFDTILCLSITMWIHLNHHDEGLMNFLEKCINLTYLLIIEPQPWKCYQNAIHRMRKIPNVFPLFHQLKWRSNIVNHIEDYLENNLEQKKIYESKPTKWNRKICFYRNKSS